MRCAGWRNSRLSVFYVLVALLVWGCSPDRGAGAIAEESGVGVVQGRADASPPDDWKPVRYGEAMFHVPAAWPVETPTAYRFACDSFSEPGVFLAPDGYTGGFRCPASADPYAATVHVQPYSGVPDGDSFDVNGLDAYHIEDGDGDYLHVALPALGVVAVIYGPDEDLTREVLRTVERRQAGSDGSADGA